MEQIHFERRLLPLITFHDLNDAEPVAKVLIDAGTPQIEIAFRSELAEDAIRIVSKIPGIKTGAGTVLTNHQAEQAVDAGASFLISPGFSEEVAKTAIRLNVPYLPGVATPTEIMTAESYGYKTLKFFPASCFGGIQTLKALQGPFQDISFLPTGGISADDYKDYLALKNVEAVGGSFITPAHFLESKDWEGLAKYIRSL